MRIQKHMAVALSSLAFAGVAVSTVAAAAPATASVVAGHGHGGGGGGGANFGEDFIVEEGDFFLNEEDDPNPHGGGRG
jgi:hypothetical protein